MDRIKVGVKLRPLIHREKASNCDVHWQAVSDTSVSQVDPATGQPKGEHHTFDHVFGPDSSNREVFEVLVKPIVESAVKGFNGTIFAYGQTASGKTYTMMGDQYEPGIIPQAVNLVFNLIENSHGREFLLRVCYMEIYNEKVHDLLCKSNRNLKISEDNTGNVFVKDLEETITSSSQQVMDLMKKGETIRKIGVTNMNERSSRSHSIFRVIIESRAADSETDEAIQVSHLNLVDLAGSERSSATGSVGDQFKEGCAINKSLFTLGKVISQLSEGQSSYVNFRDSKLTRILQSSLGGNALTAIVCAITPAALEETSSTLGFASRARNILTTAQVNEVLTERALLKRYIKQINLLKSEINNLEEEKNAENKHLQNQNSALQERLSRLKDALLVSNPDEADQSEKCREKLKKLRRRTWSAPNRNVTRLSLAVPVKKKTESVSFLHEIKEEDSRLSMLSTQSDLDESMFVTPMEEFEKALIKAERDKSIDWLPSVDMLEEDVFRKSIDTETESTPALNYVQTRRNKGHLNRLQQESVLETPPSKLRAKIEIVEKELEEMTEFTKLEKQMFDENLMEENKALTSELSRLKNELQECRDECNTLLDVKKHLENLKLSDKNSHDLQVLLLDTTKELSKLNDEKKELCRKLSNAEAQSTDVKKLKEEMDIMKKELCDTRKEKLLLKANLAKQEEQLRHLQNEKEDFDFQFDIMRGNYEKKLKDLTQALEDARMEMNTPQHVMRHNDNGGLYSLAEEPTIDELVQQMEILKEENNYLLQEVSSKSSLLEEISSKQERISQLEQELSTLSEGLQLTPASLEAEVESLKSENNVLKGELASKEELVSTNEALKTELADLKNASESHSLSHNSSKLDMNKTSCQNCMELDEKLCIAKSLLCTNIDENLCDENTSLESMIQLFAASLKNTKEQYAVLEQRHEACENAVKSSAAELEFLEQRCNNSEEELATIRGMLSSIQCSEDFENLSLVLMVQKLLSHVEESETHTAVSKEASFSSGSGCCSKADAETQCVEESIVQADTNVGADLNVELECLQDEMTTLKNANDVLAGELEAKELKIKNHAVEMEQLREQIVLLERVPIPEDHESNENQVETPVKPETEQSFVLEEAEDKEGLVCDGDHLDELKALQERCHSAEEELCAIRSILCQKDEDTPIVTLISDLLASHAKSVIADTADYNGPHAIDDGTSEVLMEHQKQIAELVSTKNSLVSELDCKSSVLADAEVELKQLKERVQELCNRPTSEQKPSEQLICDKDEVLTLKSEKEALERELEEKNLLIAESHEELEQVRRQTQDLLKTLEHMPEESCQKCVVFLNELASSQKLLSSELNDEELNDKASIPDLVDRVLVLFKSVNQECSQLKQEVQNKTSQCLSTLEEVSSLQKQCENLENEIHSAHLTLLTEVKAISADDDLDKLPLPSLVSEFLKSVMAAQQHVASVLQLKIEHCSTELEASIQRESESQKVIEELRHEVKHYLEKNQTLKEALDDVKLEEHDTLELLNSLNRLRSLVEAMETISPDELVSIVEKKLLTLHSKMDEVKHLQSEIEQQLSENDALRSNIASLEKQISEQVEMIFSLEQNASETKQALLDNEENLGKLKEETSHERLVAKDLITEIVCKEELAEKQEGQLLELQLKLEECSSEQSLVDDLKSVIASKQDEVHQLEDKLKQLLLDQSNEAERLNNLTNKNANLQSTISALDKQVSDQKELITELEQSVSEAKQALIENEETLQKLNEVTSHERSVAENLRSEITCKEEFAKNLEDQLLELQQRLEGRSLDSELVNDLKSDSTSQEDQLHQHLEDKLRQSLLELSEEGERASKLSVENATLKSSIAALDKQVTEQRELIMELEQERGVAVNLRTELETKEELVKNLQDQLQGLQDDQSLEIASLEKQVSDQKELVTELEQSLAVAKQALTETEENMAKLKEEISDERGVAANLRAEVEIKEELVKNLQDQLQGLQEDRSLEIASLEKQVSDQKELVTELEQSFAAAKQALTETEENMEKMKEEVSEERRVTSNLRTEVEIKEELVKNLQDQLQERLESRSLELSLVDELKSVIASKDDEKNQLEDKLKKSLLDLTNEEERANSLSDENAHLKSSIGALNKQISEQQELITELEQSVSEAKQALVGNEETLQNLKEENANLKARNDAGRDLLHSRAVSLHNELSEKKELTSRLESDLSDKISLLQEKEQKMDTLQKCVDDLEKHKAILESDLLKAKAEKDLALKNLALKSAVTPSEALQELKAENEFLKQQHEEVLKASRDMRTRNRKFQAEINKLKEKLEEQEKSRANSELESVRGQLHEEVLKREELENQLDQICKLERSKTSRVSDIRKKRASLDVKELENLKHKEELYRLELTTKSEALTNLNKILKEKTETIDRLEAQLQDCQECKNNLEKIAELEKDKKDLDHECEELLSWGRVHENNYNQSIDKLAELLKNLAQTKLKLTRVAIGKVQFLSNLCSEMVSSLDKVTAEQVEMQLSSKEKAARNANGRVAEMDIKIEEASCNISLLENLCTNLQKECDAVLNLDDESMAIWKRLSSQKKPSLVQKDCTECNYLSKWGKDEEAKAIKFSNEVTRLEGRIKVLEEKEVKLFNTRSARRKQVELDDDKTLQRQCPECISLKENLQKQRTEIADKNAEIVHLKIKLEVQNKPLEETIKRLEGQVRRFKDENASLRAEMHSQEKSLFAHCRVSTENIATQTTETTTEIYRSQYWTGAPSGIVEEANKALLETRCKKLEQEKDAYKNLCVKRKEHIEYLEKELNKNLNKENQENSTYFTRSRKK